LKYFIEFFIKQWKLNGKYCFDENNLFYNILNSANEEKRASFVGLGIS
jgi:hypothetical protein